MYILDNQMFGYGRGMTEKYDTNFFGNEIMRENSKVIKNLTWAQLTRTNGTFNLLQSINHNLGLTLTQQQHSHLKAGFEILCKKTKNENQKTMSLKSFFGLKA